jgi:hypothetical protein
MRDPDFPCEMWDEVADGEYVRRAERLILSDSGKVDDAAEASRLRELGRRRREAGIVDDALALSDSEETGDEAERSRKRELNWRRQEAGLAAV